MPRTWATVLPYLTKQTPWTPVRLLCAVGPLPVGIFYWSVIPSGQTHLFRFVNDGDNIDNLYSDGIVGLPPPMPASQLGSWDPRSRAGSVPGILRFLLPAFCAYPWHFQQDSHAQRKNCQISQGTAMLENHPYYLDPSTSRRNSIWKNGTIILDSPMGSGPLNRATMCLGWGLFSHHPW